MCAVTNASPAILKLQSDNNGELPSFAWPGRYPLFYLDAESNCLCPDCARKNDEYTAALEACDVNWEDATLFCDQCSKRIESAYAE